MVNIVNAAKLYIFKRQFLCYIYSTTVKKDKRQNSVESDSQLCTVVSHFLSTSLKG